MFILQVEKDCSQCNKTSPYQIVVAEFKSFQEASFIWLVSAVWFFLNWSNIILNPGYGWMTESLQA